MNKSNSILNGFRSQNTTFKEILKGVIDLSKVNSEKFDIFSSFQMQHLVAQTIATNEGMSKEVQKGVVDGLKADLNKLTLVQANHHGKLKTFYIAGKGECTEILKSVKPLNEDNESANDYDEEEVFEFIKEHTPSDEELINQFGEDIIEFLNKLDEEGKLNVTDEGKYTIVEAEENSSEENNSENSSQEENNSKEENESEENNSKEENESENSSKEENNSKEDNKSENNSKKNDDGYLKGQVLDNENNGDNENNSQEEENNSQEEENNSQEEENNSQEENQSQEEENLSQKENESEEENLSQEEENLSEEENNASQEDEENNSEENLSQEEENNSEENNSQEEENQSQEENFSEEENNSQEEENNSEENNFENENNSQEEENQSQEEENNSKDNKFANKSENDYSDEELEAMAKKTASSTLIKFYKTSDDDRLREIAAIELKSRNIDVKDFDDNNSKEENHSKVENKSENNSKADELPDTLEKLKKLEEWTQNYLKNFDKEDLIELVVETAMKSPLKRNELKSAYRDFYKQSNGGNTINKVKDEDLKEYLEDNYFKNFTPEDLQGYAFQLISKSPASYRKFKKMMDDEEAPVV